MDTFKISKDPLFVDKVRDVVGLYLAPPAKAVVLCVDEKTGTQALDRSAPVLPMLPGVPERQSFDYIRHGTRSSCAPSTRTSPPAWTCTSCSTTSPHKPYVWTRTANQILESLAAYCQRINDSGH